MMARQTDALRYALALSLWQGYMDQEKLVRQRRRRAVCRRIDYYASPAAGAVIDGVRGDGTLSNTIDQIITEWALQQPPEA